MPFAVPKIEGVFAIGFFIGKVPVLGSRLAMLSRLGKRGYAVDEEPSRYGIDPDFDSDFDPDGTKFHHR